MGLDPGNRHNKIALKCQTRHMKSRSARLQTCLLRRFPLKGQGYRLRRADLFNFKAQKAEINMSLDIALGLAWDEMGRLSLSSR